MDNITSHRIVSEKAVANFKARLDKILNNPKMVDKIIRANPPATIEEYDRVIIMKIITLSWKQAIAEAEKGKVGK